MNKKFYYLSSLMILSPTLGFFISEWLKNGFGLIIFFLSLCISIALIGKICKIAMNDAKGRVSE